MDQDAREFGAANPEGRTPLGELFENPLRAVALPAVAGVAAGLATKDAGAGVGVAVGSALGSILGAVVSTWAQLGPGATSALTIGAAAGGGFAGYKVGR